MAVRAKLRSLNANLSTLVFSPGRQPREADWRSRATIFYACDAFGTEWIEDWKAAFVGITKYRAADYKHNHVSPLTFYPGAPVYYGTNTNSPIWARVR